MYKLNFCSFWMALLGLEISYFSNLSVKPDVNCSRTFFHLIYHNVMKYSSWNYVLYLRIDHENRFLEYFRIRVTRKFHNTSKKIWIHFWLIFLNAAQNEDEVLLSKESRVVICCSSFLVSLHVANLIVFIGCSYSEVGWLFVFAYRTMKPCANAE